MILLDLNQIVIACFIALSKTKKDLSGFGMNKIRHINSSYRGKYGKLVLCCDGMESWRKDIYEFYKANRKASRGKSPIDWAQLFTFLKEFKQDLRENFPYKMLEINKAEADDIIAILALNINETHLIVSSDKDFFQLHSKTVHQMTPFKKDNLDAFLTIDNPKEYLFEKIIRGDPGDGIPNIFTVKQDIFLIENARQTPVSKISIAQIKQQMIIDRFTASYAPHVVSNFYRNMKLINFNYIPDEIRTAVLEMFSKQKIDKDYNNVLNYFIAKKMKNLTDCIQDF